MEYECGSFKRNSSIAPFSLFILFLSFFYFFVFFGGLNGSYYLTLICPLWDLLNLSSLGSFPQRATLYFTRGIEDLHTLQVTQHKEDVAIMMYANVCLCQCSRNMYDMKIKSKEGGCCIAIYLGKDMEMPS